MIKTNLETMTDDLDTIHEQLRQIATRDTKDSDLISVKARDCLIEIKCVEVVDGINKVTDDGIKHLNFLDNMGRTQRSLSEYK